MAERIPIAVDMMGGDFAPQALIGGIVEALDRFGDANKLFLVGDKAILEPELAANNISLDNPNIELVHASEVVGMGEHPVQAIRSKRDSSINVCMDLSKAGRVQGVFSAGNTGAAVSSAFLKWRMLPGLARPGIATIMPSLKGKWLLMDAGATVDCAPTHLAQFAIMGDLYCKYILNKTSPRVGLLSNGTEPGKGTRVTQEAFNLIQNIHALNFVGNIEGHDLFTGDIDVVVCDGFIGNVVLKTSEQLGKTLGAFLKEQLMSKTVWKLGASMCKGAFDALKQLMDASEVGGAPLLGVNGNCIIGHGNSTPHAVANGIQAVSQLISSRINEHIVNQIHEYAMNNIG